MKEAIQKAIEGGWHPTYLTLPHLSKFRTDKEVLLDPLFWQALGKSLGWSASKEFETRIAKSTCSKCGDTRVTMQWAEWQYHWHDFIAHLADGGNIDDFFTTLLETK